MCITMFHFKYRVNVNYFRNKKYLMLLILFTESAFLKCIFVGLLSIEIELSFVDVQNPKHC